MSKQLGITYNGVSFEAVLPLPPISNHRLIPVDGKLRLSRVSSSYMKDVKKMRQGKPFETKVGMKVIFYRKQKRGDIDGRLKSLLDALSGVMYIDDKQISHIFLANDDDTKDPRVEVSCWKVS